MTLKIYSNISGIFVLNQEGKIIDFLKYPKNPEEIAQKIYVLSQEGKSDELEKILNKYQEETIETNSVEVMNFVRKHGRKCELNAKSETYQSFLKQISKILMEKKYIISEEEYSKLAKEVGILLTKKRVALSSEQIDKNVVHGILSMDDIDKTTNLFSSRIREWYGVHFPEILKEVQSHVTLCKIITEIGIRDNFTEEKLKDYGFSPAKCKEIAKLAKRSMGAKYREEDLVPLQNLTTKILDLYEERDKLEAWIENEIDLIAPNMKAVAGSAITARMISLAGGLKDLAMKPASTIQLLGAEKALFRALKTGAKPPKHGIIFQMPELHSCSWWQRGNIARAIAGRLTIAARVDAFQGEYIGDKLRNEVDKKISEIKEKYKEPPVGKKPPIDYSKKPPQRRKKGNKKQYKKRRR
ncbi:MAG: C/D box methylation guide ribonucleoprotein complex aNOP56 subunit [Candidatus Heimdallarchaeaceae archaeon]